MMGDKNNIPSRRKKLPGFEECLIVPLSVMAEKKFTTIVSANDVPNEEINDTNEYFEGLSANEILAKNDDSIPSDLRLKLYNRAKLNEKSIPPKPRQHHKLSSAGSTGDVTQNRPHRKPSKKPLLSSLSSTLIPAAAIETSNLEDKNVMNLLESIPSYARIIVKKIIVQFIDKNDHIVSWDPETLNIIIDNKVHYDTNISRILRYLTIDPFMHSVDKKVSSPPNGTKIFRSKLVDIGVPNTWLNKNKKSSDEYIHDPNKILTSSRDSEDNDSEISAAAPYLQRQKPPNDKDRIIDADASLRLDSGAIGGDQEHYQQLNENWINYGATGTTPNKLNISGPSPADVGSPGNVLVNVRHRRVSRKPTNTKKPVVKTPSAPVKRRSSRRRNYGDSSTKKSAPLASSSSNWRVYGDDDDISSEETE